MARFGLAAAAALAARAAMAAPAADEVSREAFRPGVAGGSHHQRAFVSHGHWQL